MPDAYAHCSAVRSYVFTRLYTALLLHVSNFRGKRSLDSWIQAIYLLLLVYTLLHADNSLSLRMYTAIYIVCSGQNVGCVCVCVRVCKRLMLISRYIHVQRDNAESLISANDVQQPSRDFLSDIYSATHMLFCANSS